MKESQKYTLANLDMVQIKQADAGQHKHNLHHQEIHENQSDIKDVESCKIEVVLSNETCYGDTNMTTLETPSHTDEEARRRTDIALVPLVCLCYVFSFLDKSLINYSSIFGLKEALHLNGSQYSWLGSIFYIGYIIGSITWTKLVQRWPQHVGKLMSSAIMFWSCITWLTPFCFNFAGIASVQFFLGLAESIVGPILLIIKGNPRIDLERPYIMKFWLCGTPTCLNLLIKAFGPGRLLTQKERSTAVEQARDTQTVGESYEWKWPQFWEAFQDPQTIFFFASAVGSAMPSTFASQFSSQFIQGFGFSALDTMVISTCPAAVIQLSTFLICSYIVSYRDNCSLYMCILVSIPPLMGALLLRFLPLSNQAGRLAGYYLTYTNTISFNLNTGLMASNYAGNTKKATASGIIFAGWAAGLIVGPQFFLDEQAPTYEMAFKMLRCYALMTILPVIQIIWYKYENGRREKLAQNNGSSLDGSGQTCADRSDFDQWEKFRYNI